MKFRYSQTFEDDFADLPDKIKVKVEKILRLFMNDQKYPSVRTKKIKGAKGIWEGRVDRKYRFTYEYEEGGILFRRIGPHKIVDEEAKQ